MEVQKMDEWENPKSYDEEEQDPEDEETW